LSLRGIEHDVGEIQGRWRLGRVGQLWVNPVLVASVETVASGTAIMLAFSAGGGTSNIITVTDTADSVVKALQVVPPRPSNTSAGAAASGT
jgi:hypothetical protein